MGYDEQYSRDAALFGSKPEAVLVRFLDRLAPGSSVLDVGAGQGRNALFVAGQGRRVHALEPSPVAAARLAEKAREGRLQIRVANHRFEALAAPQDPYAAVLVFGLIPDLTRELIDLLVACIDSWTGCGSLLFLTGFTTGDPAYAQHARTLQCVARHSFVRDDGSARTYLEPGEILSFFPDYRVLHHAEELGPEHRHSGGSPERHAMFEAVLER